LNIDLNQHHKQLVWDFWKSLEMAQAGDIETVPQRYMHKDALWHGPDPIDDLQGPNAFVSGFWQPLIESFPDIKRQTHIFFGGKSSGRIDGSGDGRLWVCGTGYFNGTFANDYLSIPATGRDVSIRWGEFCRMENDKIVETYILLDLIDLMQQAGCHVLPPSRGIDGVYPPPQANDGVLLNEQDAGETDYTLNHIRRFIFEGLNSYDQSELGTATTSQSWEAWEWPTISTRKCNGMGPEVLARVEASKSLRKITSDIGCELSRTDPSRILMR